MSRNNNVIDFSKVRSAKLEEMRRKYERVLFRNILGAYCVIDNKQLDAVELVDVSTDGLSFQLPITSKNCKDMVVGKETSFRLYFSQETFLPLTVKITNKRECIENGGNYIRYGCQVAKNSQSYDTYRTFVQFLVQFADTAKTDTGDLRMSFF